MCQRRSEERQILTGVLERIQVPSKNKPHTGVRYTSNSKQNTIGSGNTKNTQIKDWYEEKE